MNKVIILGRLTRDVELRSTQTGKSVASFTIACNRPHKADQQQQADFISCVAWTQIAEVAAKYLAKGSQVLVEGSIQTRSYDGNDNKKVYVTEVLVRNLEFVGNKSQGQSQDNGASSFGSEVLPDEEIPF